MNKGKILARCFKDNKINSIVEPVRINYAGDSVRGKKLIVYSELPIRLEDAWNEVQKSSLLRFIVKGMMTFQPIDGQFPAKWKEKTIVKTKMLLWGFIPFGGVHILKFIKIDSANNVLLTHESDKFAKIWNHRISIKELALEKVEYKDEIEIYGGKLTNIITFWAKLFYKHRQKRWQLVAKKMMNQK